MLKFSGSPPVEQVPANYAMVNLEKPHINNSSLVVIQAVIESHHYLEINPKKHATGLYLRGGSALVQEQKVALALSVRPRQA